MMPFLHRLRGAWQRHGWRLLGPMIFVNVRHYWRRLMSTGSIAHARSAVDRIPGVETHHAVYLSELALAGPHGDEARPYEPIAEVDFDAVMGALPIDPHRYTFVDLGSGKGRALLLAARAGFGRVIGVEYSVDLHRSAQRNLESARPHWPNVAHIELVCGDAASFVPPDGPTICYMYNPFGAVVMSEVLDRWTRHLASHGDDVWIVYGNPEQLALVQRSTAFEQQGTVAGFAMFRRRR